MLFFTVDIVNVDIIFANVEIAVASMSSAFKSIPIVPDNVIGLEIIELGKLSRCKFHVGVHALAYILLHNVCWII